MAPDVRDAFQEKIKDKHENLAVQEYLFEKIRPAVEKQLKEKGVDYESVGPSMIITGEEFLRELNPDKTLPFNRRISVDYLFEEWLDTENVYKTFESFEKELDKLSGTFLLYFYIDV